MATHNIGSHTTPEEALDIMLDLIATNIQMTGMQYKAVEKFCYQNIKTKLTVADLIEKKEEKNAS